MKSAKKFDLMNSISWKIKFWSHEIRPPDPESLFPIINITILFFFVFLETLNSSLFQMVLQNKQHFYFIKIFNQWHNFGILKSKNLFCHFWFLTEIIIVSGKFWRLPPWYWAMFSWSSFQFCFSTFLEKTRLAGRTIFCRASTAKTFSSRNRLH